jgi:hypothetical protein
MTPEAQRIAIAEACGYKDVHEVIVRNVKFHGDDRKGGITSDKGWIPDYLNDLNAMHEAEKVIPDGHVYWEFVEQLRQIVDSKHNDYVAHVASATAAQRAEAFLKTLGLWKD